MEHKVLSLNWIILLGVLVIAASIGIGKLVIMPEPVVAEAAVDIVEHDKDVGTIYFVDNEPTFEVLPAFCDPHRAFSASEKVQAEQEELKELTEKFKIQAQTKQDAYEAAVKAKATAEELVDLKSDTKAFLKVANAQVTARSLEISEAGYAAVYEAIDQVARSKDLCVVLSAEVFPLASKSSNELINKVYMRRHVLYSRNELDITDEVIEVMNNAGGLGERPSEE